MLRIPLEPDFHAWRDAARAALQQGYLPAELDLQDASVPRTGDLLLEIEQPPRGIAVPHPFVPKAFIDKAQRAAVHRSPDRWNLLYRLLYRLQTERELLRFETDDDIAELNRLNSQVARDLHKMHAFVRFRKLEADDADRASPAPVPGEDNAHYIAWYAPDHRILALAAPFFAERFAIMRWTILTPDATVAWDPAGRQLAFGPGVAREHATATADYPEQDELETLWKSYYGSIFNPARLNPGVMRGEMPVRYWQNLPEVDVLPQLISKANLRVSDMMTTQKSKPSAASFVPADHTIPQIAAALPTCEGCDLYRHAIQVVPGSGPATAHLMLVGEQPGDQEDKQGSPFVGPAGGVLRRALEDLRIDPAQVYMTNAVKHFKFVQRGKLRLHQNPRMSEITACKPWLLAEIDAVRPRVVLCLGASAAKSLLGGTFALMQQRGTVVETPFASRVMATVHPSAVLRARDQPSQQQLQHFFSTDLAAAWHLAQSA